MPRIEFQVKCHQCGTSLTGLDSAPACPGCARRILDPVDARLLDVATGMVGVDLTCITCMYNLRTLLFDAACPECGSPVAGSLQVEELRFCDAAWLRRIRKGLTIVVVSVLATILLMMVSARCAAGSGEMLVESAVRQLHILYALAAKEAPAAGDNQASRR